MVITAGGSGGAVVVIVVEITSGIVILVVPPLPLPHCEPPLASIEHVSPAGQQKLYPAHWTSAASEQPTT
jgi:hypothetical protein